MRWQPSLQIIPHYESEPLYINSLKNSLEKKISELAWEPDLVVASYHGIPKNILAKETLTIATVKKLKVVI